MGRKALRLNVRPPPCMTPRNRWRRKISSEALRGQEKAGVRYSIKDRLEIQIRLYLGKESLEIHDVEIG